MRRLLLLRHAKAAPYAGGGDSERPLTDRGRRDAAMMGRYIAAQGLTPDTVVASSAKRTRETLALVADAFEDRRTTFIEPALYLAEPETLLAHLRRTPETTHTLLAIGHNPGFAELAVALTGSGDFGERERMIYKYPTCGLAVLEFPFDDWREAKVGGAKLVRFATPRELRDSPFSAD